MAPAMKRAELLPSGITPLRALLYTSKEKKFSACGCKQAAGQRQQQQQQQNNSSSRHVSINTAALAPHST
jgi:hypothetical protein